MNRKLFVVGNDSPDPEDWSEWDEVVIVLAENEEEAQDLAEDHCGIIAEIPLTKSMIIYSAPSPELWHGDDT